MADIYTAIRARCLPPNAAIAALASGQHGVVARWQLLRLGLSDAQIQSRIAGGLLHRIHLGVYAVGHPAVGDRGRLAAARLAVGPGAALSHSPAAWVLGFERNVPTGVVDVIVSRGRARSRSRSGIGIHHTRGLPPEDVVRVDGIWVTSRPRTLAELCGTSSSTRMRRLYEEADRLGLIDRREVAAILERLRSRKGIGKLRRLHLSHCAPPPVTESHAEHRFFRLWEATGRPMPEVNVGVCGYRVDFFWRAERLIVELDGPSFHDRRGQGERDRLKDVELALRGFEVHRFGTGRVYVDPTELLDQVSALLDRRRRSPP